MDKVTETTLEAFERAPVAMQVIRLHDENDPGSFYPVACNRAACEALRQDIKSDLGKTWNEASPDLARSEFATMFRDALTDGKPVSWETDYGDSRFEKNWWRGTAEPIDDRTLIMCFQNVTVEKQNQLELKRSNEELDRFAYVASHDLKAPLRDIDNLASWVLEEDDGLSEKSLERLESLRGRAKRLEKLLADLLEFSRTGREKTKSEKFVLKEVYEHVRETVPVPAEFIIHFGGSEVELVAPRVPLETILRNLVGNAVKHHDRTHGEVWVRARATGSEVEFEVADDGPGIPKQWQDKAFAMFTTLRPRDEVEGSGLGLAIARKLVARYGDSLTLDSGTGRGCTFRWAWPIVSTG